MHSILYIHGFLSSPQSSKAQLTKAWLQQHYPGVGFICPQFSAYPGQVKAQLDAIVTPLVTQKLCVIGSSMGGFWATYLVERGMAEKAVLINPAVLPHVRFKDLAGVPQKCFYSDEVVTLTSADIEELASLDVATISHPAKYWLMVQSGDETLDYRLAVDKYRQCKQTVEEGGNHSFEGYDKWLPEIMGFLTA